MKQGTSQSVARTATPSKDNKHTPGPWEVQKLEHADGELWVQIGWKDRRGISWGPIAEMRNLVTSVEEQEANARLIAKAPEMYELLEAVIAACRNPVMLGGEEVAIVSHEIMTKARRIKAEIDGVE